MFFKQHNIYNVNAILNSMKTALQSITIQWSILVHTDTHLDFYVNKKI